MEEEELRERTEELVTILDGIRDAQPADLDTGGSKQRMSFY